MRKTLLTTFVGFLCMMISATFIALAMRPLVGPMFGELARSDAEGLNFFALLFGYLIVAIVLVWFVPRVQTKSQGWMHGLKVGAALGLAVFLGDHMVTAGWSKLPSVPMFISGALDTLAVVIGGVVVASMPHRRHG